MYRFPNERLVLTDTDSLYYCVRGVEYLEKKLFENKEREKYLDFSDYPFGHPYRNETNKMVIGKFKCETRGAEIVEIVGLRPKMYSYIISDANAPDGLKEKKRIKGISRAAPKSLRHQNYLEQLREAQENNLSNRRIGINLHQIYPIAV